MWLNRAASGESNPRACFFAVDCGNCITVRLARTPSTYSCRESVALAFSCATHTVPHPEHCASACLVQPRRGTSIAPLIDAPSSPTHWTLLSRPSSSSGAASLQSPRTVSVAREDVEPSRAARSDATATRSALAGSVLQSATAAAGSAAAAAAAAPHAQERSASAFISTGNRRRGYIVGYIVGAAGRVLTCRSVVTPSAQVSGRVTLRTHKQYCIVCSIGG